MLSYFAIHVLLFSANGRADAADLFPTAGKMGEIIYLLFLVFVDCYFLYGAYSQGLPPIGCPRMKCRFLDSICF